MPIARRFTAAAAVIAAAALALTGCQFLPDNGDGSTDDPEGLEKFYSQELTWTEEGDLLDSTEVEVPLDWSEPDGDTIEIAIMRHQAVGASLGSLLMNPGGPGGSGYDYVRDYAQYLVSPDVLEQFDLIGFDPRGVNHSNPVICYTEPADRDEYLYGTYENAYGTAGWVDELTEREKAYAAACEENTGPLLAHIDAGSVARDMDVMRAVLGDDKINYLGYSYGTYLGTMYAELFPEKVGKMVLDGAVDPSVSDLDALAFQMGGFESALRAFVVDCQANNPACPFTGDADAAMTQIRALLDGIDAKGLVGSDGRELDSATVGTGIADYLYSDSLWPDLRDRLQRPARRQRRLDVRRRRRLQRPQRRRYLRRQLERRLLGRHLRRGRPRHRFGRHAGRHPGAAGEGADHRRLLRLRRHLRARRALLELAPPGGGPAQRVRRGRGRSRSS